MPRLIAYTPRGGLKCPIKILPTVYKDSNNLCLQILCVLCVMLAVDKGTFIMTCVLLYNKGLSK